MYIGLTLKGVRLSMFGTESEKISKTQLGLYININYVCWGTRWLRKGSVLTN